MQDTIDGFTPDEATEFVKHLAPQPRPMTYQDVVKALNQKIAALEAELEAERAKQTQRIPFYEMINTLDLHRKLLNAAQGDKPAQVHAIALIVRSLETYVKTLADGES